MLALFGLWAWRHVPVGPTCGTVLSVPLDGLPDWLPGWCLDHLGGEPAGVLFQSQQVSMVFGLRLAGGRDVVVKARADDGRAASCVAVQARLAERGFPCARPLTPVVGVGALAVHAEEFRPGGEVLHGDSPDDRRALRGGVRPADGRTCRRDRRAAAAESALGALGSHRFRGVAGDRLARPPGPEPRVRAHCRDGASGPGRGCWPPACRACSATPTSRRRTCGGRAGRCGRCTTGTAWRGSRRRRWWERRAGRSPVPGRPRWRRSRAPRRSWWLIRTSEGACSRPWSGRSHGRPACGWLRYNAREMALCGGSPAGGDALRAQAAERLRRANA